MKAKRLQEKGANYHKRMKYILSIITAGFLINTAVKSQEILVWQDEFNGTTLNANNWEFQLGNGCPNLCGWGNNELQTYSNQPQNVKVENGSLKITAINTNNNWTSGRIRSLGNYDFCLGKIEVRAKIPAGRGFWPAAWFLPSETHYGQWPMSGEIDLLEIRGQEPEKTLGTIHYGPLSPNNQYSGNELTLNTGSFADDFHVFAVEWNKDTIIWKVDGIEFSEKTRANVGDFRWPFDRNFHAILNLAVGGNFLGNPDGTTPLQGTFEVDYVRVYQNPQELIISGPEAIIKGNDTYLFYTQEIPGFTYNWTIPAGAQLLTGQGTKAVTVKWGFSSDSIKVALNSTNQNTELSHYVNVIPDSCTQAFDNRDETQRLYWVGGDGNYTAFTPNPAINAVNPSNEVIGFQRNPGAQYDVLQLSTDLIQNTAPFENSTLKIGMKCYSNAPVGTEIQIMFEKRSLLGQGYPSGRRCLLNAFTTAVNAWQELTFNFVVTPDLNTLSNEIDQFTILVAPNTFTNPQVYFDDWSIKEIPCQILKVENALEIPTLVVSPNPCSDQLTITTIGSTEFILSDITGKILLISKNSKAVEDAILNGSSGIYLLSASSANRVATQKIIKF